MGKIKKYFIVLLLFFLVPISFTSCITSAILLASSHNSKKTHKAEKNNEGKNEGTVDKTRGNVVLVCAGSGATLSEAKNNALRSGLEQAYGTFVSSDTKIINDLIIRDEIVSISSGNVIGYKIISQSESKGEWTVYLEGEFSQSNLRTFAESKGATATINTSDFTMNMQLLRTRVQSIQIAWLHVIEQQEKISPYCWDYNLDISEPHLYRYKDKFGNDRRKYAVDIKIYSKPNMKNVMQISSLALEFMNGIGAIIKYPPDRYHPFNYTFDYPLDVRQQAAKYGIDLTPFLKSLIDDYVYACQYDFKLYKDGKHVVKTDFDMVHYDGTYGWRAKMINVWYDELGRRRGDDYYAKEINTYISSEDLDEKKGELLYVYTLLLDEEELSKFNSTFTIQPANKGAYLRDSDSRKYKKELEFIRFRYEESIKR